MGPIRKIQTLMLTYNALVIAVLSTKRVLSRQTTNDAPPNKISPAHTRCTHMQKGTTSGNGVDKKRMNSEIYWIGGVRMIWVYVGQDVSEYPQTHILISLL